MVSAESHISAALLTTTLRHAQVRGLGGAVLSSFLKAHSSPRVAFATGVGLNETLVPPPVENPLMG